MSPEAAAGGGSAWLRYLAAAQERLPAAERKVAGCVLARPQEILAAPLATVARLAGVSEPTVIRFCRSLGCAGFSEFKLRLAQGLAVGQVFVHTDVTPADSVAAMTAKIFGKAAGTLQQVRAQLEPARLAAAIDLLGGARRVEFYGLGNSGIVAADAQHKFFRLGVNCAAYADAHVHGMAATMLKPGDVVVAISATGRTVDLLSSIDLAREAGAATIAITAAGSALAARCDVALEIAVDEDTDVYTPMTTRLAHLAIIDVLAVGVALRQGPELRTRLQRAKDSLRSKRVRGFER